MSRAEPGAAALRRLRPAEYETMRAALAAEGLPTDDLCCASNRLYAFEEAGQVLGYGGLERHGSAVLLRSVVVRPERRRGGVGRRLVRAMLAQAAALGHAEIHLLTLSAADFFTRLGFERIERGAVPAALAATAQFTTLCPVSAVAMMRRLDLPA